MLKSKDQLIYDSWVKLFWKFWVKRVSIDMIVKDAQVAKGTFYIYYKNKEELYNKILEDILFQWREYMSYLHDSIIDIKERFFKHMVCSLWFFEKNDIIKNIISWNKDYYIWAINSEYLFSKHLEILKILFWNDLDNEEKILVISKIKWFYIEVLNMKKHFFDKEEYEKFILDLAAVLTNWLFSDYSYLHKWKTLEELQKIK